MTLPALVHHRRNDKPPALLPREAAPALSEAPPNVQPRNKKVERGRKNVSRACQVCRHRRIRCTAERPCRPCQVNGVECIDDGGPESVDLRTIRLGPQNQKVFIQQKTLLDSLLRSIRAGTADDAIKCIKDGGSLSQIARALRAVDESSIPSHKVEDSPQDGEDSSDYGKPNHFQGSVDHLDTSAKSLKNFGNLPLSSAFKANGYSPAIQEQQIVHLSKLPWQCAPLISDDASSNDLFSLSCFSFRQLARQQLASGASPNLILSLDGIEMDLLFRDRTSSDPHTVSTWACELLKTFVFLHPVVKLAGAEAVACLMRWLIAPTKENYLALPAASVPVDGQFFSPHSIGIDVMMLPEIRDALLVRNSTQAWTNILTPRTMDFNWPYSVDACLEMVPSGQNLQGTCMRLSKAFTEHIHNLNNMTLDFSVLKAFPEFQGKFRWHGCETESTLATSESATSHGQAEEMMDGVSPQLDDSFNDV